MCNAFPARLSDVNSARGASREGLMECVGVGEDREVPTDEGGEMIAEREDWCIRRG